VHASDEVGIERILNMHVSALVAARIFLKRTEQVAIDLDDVQCCARRKRSQVRAPRPADFYDAARRRPATRRR